MTELGGRGACGGELAEPASAQGLMAGATAKGPPLWPFLLVCVLVAVWIDLGGVHQHQHADSLLVVPISLYRWTPFYWELDRIGMLVPLLAAPFRNPLTNLLVQDGIDLFCGLAALFLLARYVLRDATYPVVAGFGAAAFVALVPSYYRFEYFVDTFNGVWLALGLGGLVLLMPPAAGSGRWRRLAALVLLVLAHWVYCTAALYLGTLAVLRAFFCQVAARPRQTNASDTSSRSLPAFASRLARTEIAVTLLFLLVACLAGSLIKRLSPYSPTDFGGLPVRDWPVVLRGLMANTWRTLAPQYWPAFLAAGVASGLLLLLIPAVRRQSVPALRAAGALLATASVLALVLASRKWVQLNHCNFRYLLPSALFAQAGLLILTLAPACRSLAPRTLRGLYLLAAASLLAAATYSYGRPSLDRVRTDFTRASDIHADELLETRCTHVAGSYFRVWPAVLGANLALYERGESRVVWGITLCSSPTASKWKKVPLEEMRIAIPAGDEGEAEAHCKRYGLPPLEVVEKRPTLVIARPSLHARLP